MTVKPSWAELLCSAKREVRETIRSLPTALREAAQALPVTYEARPTPELIEDGLEPDLLGLFVGDPHSQEGAAALPAQILLFLDNLWEMAEGDWDIFEEEVQKTYLHELGHYLGLDELDLEERGLE